MRNIPLSIQRVFNRYSITPNDIKEKKGNVDDALYWRNGEDRFQLITLTDGNMIVIVKLGKSLEVLHGERLTGEKVAQLAKDWKEQTGEPNATD